MRPSSDTFAGTAGAHEIAADAVEAHAYLADARTLVDAHLELLVPSDTQEPRAVHAAMRWSLFAGGKRLRPALVLARAMLRCVAASSQTAGLRTLHTYSLVPTTCLRWTTRTPARATTFNQLRRSDGHPRERRFQALAFPIIPETRTGSERCRRLISELRARRAHRLDVRGSASIVRRRRRLCDCRRTRSIIDINGRAHRRGGTRWRSYREASEREIERTATTPPRSSPLSDHGRSAGRTATAHFRQNPSKDARAQRPHIPLSTT